MHKKDKFFLFTASRINVLCNVNSNDKSYPSSHSKVFSKPIRYINFFFQIKGIFADSQIPKTKPISVGIVYRPPKDSNFLQLVAEIVNYLNILENEMFHPVT